VSGGDGTSFGSTLTLTYTAGSTTPEPGSMSGSEKRDSMRQQLPLTVPVYFSLEAAAFVRVRFLQIGVTFS
jgi:hypothetical protein